MSINNLSAEREWGLRTFLRHDPDFDSDPDLDGAVEQGAGSGEDRGQRTEDVNREYREGRISHKEHKEHKEGAKKEKLRIATPTAVASANFANGE